MAQRDSGTAPYNARLTNTAATDPWHDRPYRPGKTWRKKRRQTLTGTMTARITNMPDRVLGI